LFRSFFVKKNTFKFALLLVLGFACRLSGASGLSPVFQSSLPPESAKKVLPTKLPKPVREKPEPAKQDVSLAPLAGIDDGSFQMSSEAFSSEEFFAPRRVQPKGNVVQGMPVQQRLSKPVRPQRVVPGASDEDSSLGLSSNYSLENLNSDLKAVPWLHVSKPSGPRHVVTTGRSQDAPVGPKGALSHKNVGSMPATDQPMQKESQTLLNKINDLEEQLRRSRSEDRQQRELDKMHSQHIQRLSQAVTSLRSRGQDVDNSLLQALNRLVIENAALKKRGGRQ
jgi:hypothetical protein